MLPYTAHFTNGTACIVYARDGRHAWQVAANRAVSTGRQLADVTL